MSAAVAQASKSDAITLRGSAEIVAEFFNYGVNSILYQRGLYAAEKFDRQLAYGLPVQMTNESSVAEYIGKVCEQVKEWLTLKSIQRLVVVVKSVRSSETLERWDFKIECDKTATIETKQTTKSVKEIRKEMQNVMRQITASVAILPLLDELCTFDILIYTDTDTVVSEEWDDSDGHYISNAEEVTLSSFDTLMHKVELGVCYRVEI